MLSLWVQAKIGGVCVKHGAKVKRKRCSMVVKGAKIRLPMEECALSMEQRSSDAAVKDAQIKLRQEECAINMGQSAYDAAAMDVQVKL